MITFFPFSIFAFGFRFNHVSLKKGHFNIATALMRGELLGRHITCIRQNATYRDRTCDLEVNSLTL